MVHKGNYIKLQYNVHIHVHWVRGTQEFDKKNCQFI